MAGTVQYYTGGTGQKPKPKPVGDPTTGMVSSQTVGSDVATGGVLADRANRTNKQLDPRVYAPWRTAAENIGDLGYMGTTEYVDPNNADIFSWLREGPTTVATSYGSSGGGGGRRGGGGGGGAAGPAPLDPAVADAYRQYYASLQGGVNPYTGAMDRLAGVYDTSYLDQIYNDQTVNDRYDRFAGDVSRAARQNTGRVAGIAEDMGARNQVARGNVAQGFDARQAAIAQLADEFAQAQQGEVGGLNTILNSFDAGSVAAEAAPLQNLFAASQATVGDTANLFDQSFQDRQALGSALAADVGFGQSQAESALLSQIAAQRAAGLESNAGQRARAEQAAEAARAEAEFNAWINEQNWNQADAQRLAEARLQLAQLGIEV